jgi:UDP-N-acetylglucosamine:LPS N-acetylglucosamine transferase
MPDRPHILILTAPTGTGHISLAEALRDQLEQDFAITILHLLPGFVGYVYRFIGRHAIRLWSMAFHLSDSPARAQASHQLFVPLISHSLKRALEEIQPDLVITTHPLLSHAAKRVLEKRSPNTPFAMLFSDPYSVHSTWFTEKNATATLAPTRETYAHALAAGFNPNRLHLVGWPVRGQFYRTGGLSRAEMLTRLNLDPDRFTIFLQGGGDGGANFWRTAEHLLATRLEVQVILAAGTNKALLKRFKGVKNLYVLPFTKEIAPYMAAADVVMGKAGPNALFESVVLGKPFIATTYFPGQEKGNLEFIERYGLGWVTLKLEQQSELIGTLATDSAQSRAVTLKIQEYLQWNEAANASILSLIHSLVPGADHVQT